MELIRSCSLHAFQKICETPSEIFFNREHRTSLVSLGVIIAVGVLLVSAVDLLLVPVLVLSAIVYTTVDARCDYSFSSFFPSMHLFPCHNTYTYHRPIQSRGWMPTFGFRRNNEYCNRQIPGTHAVRTFATTRRADVPGTAYAANAYATIRRR
jgi:hypothetical protein